MPHYFSDAELARLKRLRQRLLAIEDRPADAPAPRYWDSAEDLALYHSTFAQRIAWKWRAVLQELRERGVALPAGPVLDFGCGTGAAAAEWVAAAGAARVTLWDRDASARAFARAELERVAPHVEVTTPTRAPEAADIAPDTTLLISHVLDELDGPDVTRLEALARRAGLVLWVEPGSRLTSRRLSETRDRLLESHAVLAPCTHSERCGVLRLAAARHWCHHFAEAPQAVYTEGRWAEFGRELGVDLRALPYSFCVLVARTGGNAPPTVDHADTDASGEPAAALVRLIGRARLQRGRALLDTCDARGVREELLLERHAKGLVKALDRRSVRLVQLSREGDRIVGAREVRPNLESADTDG